jgi:hypothetical protein
MMKKIIGLIICSLFITATVYPVIGYKHSLKINNYSYIKSSFDKIKVTYQEPPKIRALIIGRIENLIIYGGNAVFRAIKTRIITFNPFSSIIYTSAIMLVTLGSKIGILTNFFVLGFFNVIIYNT